MAQGESNVDLREVHRDCIGRLAAEEWKEGTAA